MVIGKPAPFVSACVAAVDEAIEDHYPGQELSAIQRAWLAFCLTAILVTNSICWARFGRASLGTYSLAALSWMFRHAKIPWEHLLVASVRMILASYGITCGSLVINDTIRSAPNLPLPFQRHLGRLEPTPYLKYRAEEVMRNLPALST